MLNIVVLVLGIIGGSPSDDEAVVCISADTLPMCSGVLIGARTVITAGHCINPLGSSVPYFVNIGADCTNPHARLRVAEMQAHPSYTGEGKPFDVGLVRLIADAGVTPMALSDVTVDASLAGRTIRHVGFGTSIETPMGGRGGRLTVSHAILRVDDDFVWSGDATANTCMGDSGGPAFLDEQVLAVVSDGPDCHSESADQRLDRAREWIDTTRTAFEPPPPEKPHTGCAAFPGGLCLLALLVFLRR